MARSAFVWGSNGSAEYGSSQLKYAEDDARRVAKVLSAPRYNFTIFNPSSPGNPYEIKRELDNLAESCQEEDVFICYFSGHGELFRGELKLVLNGTIPGNETTYLPVAWVKQARDICRANNKLIILDCCHAGAAGAKAGPIDLKELNLESKTDLMLLASDKLEIAREFEHLKGSFLTVEMCSFLVHQTRTKTVTLSRLMKHLDDAAKKHNRKSQPGPGVRNVPIPFLNGNQRGEFFFSLTTHSSRSKRYSRSKIDQKYIGRGYLMMTGRANYERMSKTINVDLVSTPERLAEPPIAAMVLIACFTPRQGKIISLLQANNFSGARRLAMGFTTGADVVRQKTMLYQDAFAKNGSLLGVPESLPGFDSSWLAVHVPAIVKEMDSNHISDPTLRAYILATADCETSQGKSMTV